MKRNFINHVTHEFRTPLNAILSATEILSEPNGKNSIALSAHQQEYVGMIQKNSNRLSSFVDDLLDLAALQQSKVNLKKEKVNLTELFENILHLHRPLANTNSTQIHVQSNVPFLHCDPDRIHQVVSNILSNAIKAAPNGSIWIDSSQVNGHIELSVRDNGAGIQQKDLPHIFSPFYKVETRKTAQKGSGLGLAVAKAWVEAHGGKIWAESEGEGKGTTVRFTLPV